MLEVWILYRCQQVVRSPSFHLGVRRAWEGVAQYEYGVSCSLSLCVRDCVRDRRRQERALRRRFARSERQSFVHLQWLATVYQHQRVQRKGKRA